MFIYSIYILKIYILKKNCNIFIFLYSWFTDYFRLIDRKIYRHNFIKHSIPSNILHTSFLINVPFKIIYAFIINNITKVTAIYNNNLDELINMDKQLLEKL